jgi:hypothetical protein
VSGLESRVVTRARGADLVRGGKPTRAFIYRLMESLSIWIIFGCYTYSVRRPWNFRPHAQPSRCGRHTAELTASCLLSPGSLTYLNDGAMFHRTIESSLVEKYQPPCPHNDGPLPPSSVPYRAVTTRKECSHPSNIINMQITRSHALSQRFFDNEFPIHSRRASCVAPLLNNPSINWYILYPCRSSHQS